MELFVCGLAAGAWLLIMVRLVAERYQDLARQHRQEARRTYLDRVSAKWNR